MPLAEPLPSQLLAARQNAFAVGHHHLNVTDLAAHKKFWGELLGGELATFGETDVVKLPDTLLFLRQQQPTGESNGSTVNHLGYRVPDLHGLAPRLKAAGFEMVTKDVVSGATQDVHYNESQDVYMAFVKGPDGIRVELMENKALDGIVSHHIHIFTEDDGATRDWYVKHFGGKPGTLPRLGDDAARGALAVAAARGAPERLCGRAPSPQRHRPSRAQEVLGRAAWRRAGHVR
jgi:catechol 2,3-dioxygenase-like lactoylglutathione lyase family enzyme